MSVAGCEEVRTVPARFAGPRPDWQRHQWAAQQDRRLRGKAMSSLGIKLNNLSRVEC